MTDSDKLNTSDEPALMASSLARQQFQSLDHSAWSLIQYTRGAGAGDGELFGKVTLGDTAHRLSIQTEPNRLLLKFHSLPREWQPTSISLFAPSEELLRIGSRKLDSAPIVEADREFRKNPSAQLVPLAAASCASGGKPRYRLVDESRGIELELADVRGGARLCVTTVGTGENEKEACYSFRHEDGATISGRFDLYVEEGAKPAICSSSHDLQGISFDKLSQGAWSLELIVTPRLVEMDAAGFRRAAVGKDYEVLMLSLELPDEEGPFRFAAPFRNERQRVLWSDGFTRRMVRFEPVHRS